MVTNSDDRTSRYGTALGVHSFHASAPAWRDRVRAVMAVADAELADLRAEVERLQSTNGRLHADREDDKAEAEAAHADADALRMALADERSKMAQAWAALEPLIDGVEGDDSGEPVCHDYDRIDNGQCALLADLLRVRAALAGPEPEASEGGDDRG